jgi:phage tail P2-like protein
MSSLLPSNASEFELAIEQCLTTDMDSPIRTLWNPLECPLDLLWVLAIVFALDEWDDDWTESVKRTSLAEAFSVHQKKGSVWSIRRILSNAGYDDAEVIEGLGSLTYDGSGTYNGYYVYGSDAAWCQYRVVLSTGITTAQATQVKKLLVAVAPLHCTLAGLHYTEATYLYNGEINYDGEHTYGET